MVPQHLVPYVIQAPVASVTSIAVQGAKTWAAATFASRCPSVGEAERAPHDSPRRAGLARLGHESGNPPTRGRQGV